MAVMVGAVLVGSIWLLGGIGVAWAYYNYNRYAEKPIPFSWGVVLEIGRFFCIASLIFVGLALLMLRRNGAIWTLLSAALLGTGFMVLPLVRVVLTKSSVPHNRVAEIILGVICIIHFVWGACILGLLYRSRTNGTTDCVVGH